MTEDEIVDGMTKSGLESEQIPGYSEGQGSPACCNPRGRKVLDMTERLNNNANSSELRKKTLSKTCFVVRLILFSN